MSGRRPDGPVRFATSRQDWLDLTFLHWRYEAAAVQRLLPPGLDVQVLDGTAWVGVTPFRMSGVRPAGLPAVPGWSLFPELNVRTYVRGPDGRDGIAFLALECDRRAVVLGLRTIGLPYVRAAGRVAGPPWPGAPTGEYRYAFARRRPLGVHGPGGTGRAFRAVVRVGDPVLDAGRVGLLDSLTGRWNAWSASGGLLWRTPVEHEPWPLWTATAEGDLDRPLRSVGLPPPGEGPLVHVSTGVHSTVGVPHPVRQDGGPAPIDRRW